MELEDENICSICLGDLKLFPKIKLNCGHYFYISCINLWKEKKNICPICRKEINNNKKKYKRKSCISPLELFLIIAFLILFISFFVFMILKSAKKLKLKKKGNPIYNSEIKNKYDKYEKYFTYNLFFDLFRAKKKDRINVLLKYAKKTPIIIKNKIENFFDDMVEGFDEFMESVHEFNELRKHWNDK